MKNATRIIAIVLVLLMALALIPMAAWAEGEHEHVYSESFTVDVEPTCIAEGSKSRHCTVEGCDAKTDVTPIEKTAHNYAAEFTTDTPATCIAEGSKSRHCTVEGCDAKTDVTPIEKTAHNYAAEFIVDQAATCTAAGSKSRHCTTEGCDAKTDVTQVEMTAHSFTAETVEEAYLKSAATCQSPAIYYKSCAVCGLSSAGTAGEATFTAGKLGDHTFNDAYVCTTCGVEALRGTLTVTGSPVVGQTLTASFSPDNDMTGKNPVYTYTWIRMSNGAGAIGTGASYTLTEANAGQTICCGVSCEGFYGRAYSNSFQVQDRPVEITVACNDNARGTIRTGEHVFVPGDANQNYVMVPKGNSVTFTLTPADNCRVKSVTFGGTPLTAGNSVTVTANAAGTLNVVFEKGLPGNQFTATVGALSGGTPDSNGVRTYSMEITAAPNGTEANVYPISGVNLPIPIPEAVKTEMAAGQVYQFAIFHVNADNTRTPVSIVASNNNYVYGSYTDFSPFELVATPAEGEMDISGEPIVGYTMTAVPGTGVTPKSPTSYQWKLDGVAISGANSSTYVLKAADAGKVISCELTTVGDVVLQSKSSATVIPLPAPKVKDGKMVIDDGTTQKAVIEGVTAQMEYVKSASDPNTEAAWTGAPSITGTSFSVSSGGTYWVRVKGELGTRRSVTVDDYYTITTRLLYGKGTVDPTTRTVKRGASGGKFTFTPNKNYKIADIRIDGTRVPSSKVATSYTLGAINSKTLLEYGFTYTGTTPHTGDDSHLALWAELFALSALGLAAVVTAMRRKDKG